MKPLTNIIDVGTHMTLHCNAGKSPVTMKSNLKSFGTVWHHPIGIANILSLSNLKKKYQISYDSATAESFIVHNSNRPKHVFIPSKKG